MGDKKAHRQDSDHANHAGTSREPADPVSQLAPVTPAQLQAQAAAYQRVDRDADARELRAAMSARNAAKILAVLARNVDAEAMCALRRAYGDGFGADLHATLNAGQFAQARAYAGEQIALTVQLGTHGRDAIFRDLERLSDVRALELVMTSTSVGVIAPVETQSAPRASTLAEVQAVLRTNLTADEYYRAMRLILDKAKRAVAHDPGAGFAAFVGFTADERDVHAESMPQALLIGLGTGNPIPALRVDLAEERLRAADGAPGTKVELDAYLALADLNADERRALAMRLQARPLRANPIGATQLEATQLEATQLAEADDATVIQQAIQIVGARALVTHQIARGVGLDVAIERAGKLVRDTRAKVNDPATPADQREPARRELARLEAMFFGTDAYYVKAALRSAAGGDDAAYKEKLEAIGADPVTTGAELLGGVTVVDFDRLIALLSQIPAEYRRAAMERAGKVDDLAQLPPDRRELAFAYLDVGNAASDSAKIAPPAGIVPGAPVPEGPGPIDLKGLRSIGYVEPEVTIALADVLDGIARGPTAAHLVLARLQRMPYDLRRVLFAQPRYRAAVLAMPRGEPRSPERDFVDAMDRAEHGDTGPDLAITNYPGPAGPYQQVVLEHIRMQAERVGQATLRRGFVIHERIGDDAKARADLSPADRVALQHYEELEALKPTFDSPAQGEVADDLMFGSVQLTDSREGALDPNLEARFMKLRLHRAAGLAPDQPLSSWAGSPAAIEALTEFQTLYTNERPGGMRRGALAQLAEIYYRALREIEKSTAKLAENETLASIAATVAGVVVAVGIGILSAGTAVPLLAVAGLSGVSAGVASAAAGAAVRIHNTDGSVLRDFGAGVIEGVTSIAGAGLAAKVVRGTAAGVSGGRAAGQICAHVAGEATGHASAAAIAEAAIDGAFSGAAGELFQTAVDEATWDRGVGEAIAKMLAALARGGALGAAAGGVIASGLARLAKRVGPEAAEGVGRMLDRATISHELVDGLGERAQDELVRATHLIERGRLEEAEQVIGGIAGIPTKQRELLIAAARARSVFRTAGEDGIELEGTFRFPEFVDDVRFRELAGTPNAHAMVQIRDGNPIIIARKGTPRAAILEEVIHLHQWESDVVMRARMQHLGEEHLAKWAELAPQHKLALHVDKLEVEADAQRRILEHLSGSEDDPEAAMRALDAAETLFLIDERLARLTSARPPLDVVHLDIDKVPRLFATGAQTVKPAGPGSRKASKLIGRPVEDAETQQALEAIGYRVHRFEGDGEIIRITRSPDKPRLPHLSVEDGKVVPGKPRQSFNDMKRAAAAEWNTKQEDLQRLAYQLETGKLGAKDALAAEQQLAESGWRQMRGELHQRVERGQIDAGTAGLVAKWGEVAEALDSRFGVSLKAMLQRHLSSKSITATEFGRLRDEIREVTVAELMKLAGKKRATVLHEMLELQPDNASKGLLFREYRREAMKLETDTNEIPLFDVADGARPESFSGAGLRNRRTPDDVVHVTEEAEGHLQPGRYAVEDKTGKAAFKLDQAEDYAKRSYNAGKQGGGFKTTPHSKDITYDGLIYVFSTQDEAKAAFKVMQENKAIKKVLGEEPGGIHIMYVNQYGKIDRMQIDRMGRT